MHHVTAASLRSVPSPPVRTRLPTLVKKQPREAVVGVWMRVAASIKLCAALMRAHGFMCVDTTPVRSRQRVPLLVHHVDLPAVENGNKDRK